MRTPVRMPPAETASGLNSCVRPIPRLTNAQFHLERQSAGPTAPERRLCKAHSLSRRITPFDRESRIRLPTAVQRIGTPLPVFGLRRASQIELPALPPLVYLLARQRPMNC